MLSKTCTRILRPYGFEDVHAPLLGQYALNRSIRLHRIGQDRANKIVIMTGAVGISLVT
jgi:hypothetical protein